MHNMDRFGVSQHFNQEQVEAWARCRWVKMDWRQPGD
jgi:hypothetical protein